MRAWATYEFPMSPDEVAMEFGIHQVESAYFLVFRYAVRWRAHDCRYMSRDHIEGLLRHYGIWGEVENADR